MSVGFGFSTGDFTAAIELVGTVVDALRSSGDVGAEYRELVCQLLSLESALVQVKRLEFEESQYAEVIALRQAAGQCQRTIDAFWEKIGKYQPALCGTGHSSKIKEGWLKIKWAVCRKEDIANFKADLVGHTESIQLLLTTVQMKRTSISDKKQDEQQRSLVGIIQDSYLNCMHRLMVVVEQGKQMLDMTSSILRANLKVFQVVLQIQQIIGRVPAQVEREQPVNMIDALGRHSPFHLEFIRSAEAFVAVLKVNFKKHGNGAQKIEKGEFVIQDAITKRDFDLRTDWETCFSPGQRVMMSMILTRALVPDIKCPKCDAPNIGSSVFGRNVDIDCPSCGLAYRRVSYQEDRAPSDLLGNRTAAIDFSEAQALECTKAQMFGPPAAFLKRKFEGDDLSDFRRVRIRAKQLVSLQEPSVPTYSSRNNIRMHRASNHAYWVDKAELWPLADDDKHPNLFKSQDKSLSETRSISDLNFSDPNLLHRFYAGLREVDDDDKPWVDDYIKHFPAAGDEKIPNIFRVQLLHSLHNM